MVARYAPELLDKAIGLSRDAEAARIAGEDAAAALEPKLAAIADLLDEARDHVRARLSGDASDAIRRLLWLIDSILTYTRGMLVDRVVFDGFDVIDAWDFRDWMRRHGAMEDTVNSTLVRAAYDYIFAYEGGDATKPRLAAGVALRMVFRMQLCGRGALFWKMQAGMGDTVLTPIYEVLRARGVKFRFFHRVQEVCLDQDGTGVGSVRIARQVDLLGDEYHPLVDVKGLPCWPSAPLLDQVDPGQAARIRAQRINLESAWSGWEDAGQLELHAGRDFDTVILGISIGALPYVCPTLIATNARWAAAIAAVGTVQTQAMQLWTKPTLAKLGWTRSSPVLTSYDEPFDTWADLTHLLPREDWAKAPGSLAYFCGAMLTPAVLPPTTDTSFPAAQAKLARRNADAWLASSITGLWPDASGPGKGTLTSKLVGGREGQYYRANVNPSDRYVLSLPGTTDRRLSAATSGFHRLVLAGDWLRTGLNYDCVESATMSGIQACRAICGMPAVVPGETDFPEPKA